MGQKISQPPAPFHPTPRGWAGPNLLAPGRRSPPANPSAMIAFEKFGQHQFAGSERGGHRAAFMYSLIGSAKLNGVDPQAWLADIIARLSDLPVSRLPELLRWNWQQSAIQPEKAA
jgi:hypothetical protein